MTFPKPGVCLLTWAFMLAFAAILPFLGNPVTWT
jgi:hypothetical protein